MFCDDASAGGGGGAAAIGGALNKDMTMALMMCIFISLQMPVVRLVTLLFLLLAGIAFSLKLSLSVPITWTVGR